MADLTLSQALVVVDSLIPLYSKLNEFDKAELVYTVARVLFHLRRMAETESAAVKTDVHKILTAVKDIPF